MLNKIEAVAYLENIKYNDGMGDMDNIEGIIQYIEYMHGKCERLEMRAVETRERIHDLIRKL